jgi:hypothetical protein
MALTARRPMFLRRVVLQSVVATLLLAGALAYGGRLHGASLLMVPMILVVLVGTSGFAGLLPWRLDDGTPPNGGLRHLGSRRGCVSCSACSGRSPASTRCSTRAAAGVPAPPRRAATSPPA